MEAEMFSLSVYLLVFIFSVQESVVKSLIINNKLNLFNFPDSNLVLAKRELLREYILLNFSAKRTETIKKACLFFFLT